MATAGARGAAGGARGANGSVVVVGGGGGGEQSLSEHIVALEGLRVTSLDDLWVRLTRSAIGRSRLTAPPSVQVTVVRPDGTERDVEIPLR